MDEAFGLNPSATASGFSVFLIVKYEGLVPI
jgi:hypothetical protein